MAKLILHIGTEKTGTTALQRFLALNRSTLLFNGLYVPDFLGPFTHYRLPILFYDDNLNDDLTLAANFPSDSLGRATEKEKCISELRQAIQSNRNSTFLISSEHLQSRLSGRMISQLQSLVDELFDQVLVVVYLRDPLLGAISLLSTEIKFGRQEAVLLPPDNNVINKIFNHKQTLIDWINAFGEARVQPRLFADNRLEGGSIVHDFFMKAGAKIDDQYQMPPRENEALSYAGMQLLASLNKLGAQELHNNRSFDALVDNINQITGHEAKYRCSKEEAAAYREAFSESNEWVRRKYFQDHHFLWEEAHEIDYSEGGQECLAPETESVLLSKLILNSYLVK